MVVLDHTWLNLDWLVMVRTAIRYVDQCLDPLTVLRTFQKSIMFTFLFIYYSDADLAWRKQESNFIGSNFHGQGEDSRP